MALHARQRGMATILVVMLAGMALTVTALGIMYSVRTSQDKQVTVHATTHSQAGAWVAVEALRLYLQTLDKDALDGLAASAQLAFTIAGNKVTAQNFALEPITGDTNNTHRFATDISYQDVAARASSTISVVYDVIPANSATTPSREPWSDVLNIYNDLNMTGGISILGGDLAKFNVDGSVNLDSASITGIKTLKATGNISIGSGIKVEELYSNGDISLTGSASVLSASALGNITTNSGGSQGVLNANGNIIITNGSVATANALGFITASSGGTHGTFTAAKTISISNGSTTLANAEGNVTLTGGSATTVNSESNVSSSSQQVSTINANGSVTALSPVNINATGDVTLNGWGSANVRSKGSVTVNSGNLSSVLASGNLTFNGWGSASGTIGGTLTKEQQYNGNVNVNVQPGLVVEVPTVDVVPMAQLSAFTLTRPRVDAYGLKTSANYVFQRENGRTKVTVRNINGIADGDYYIGYYQAQSNDRVDYLCKEVNSSGLCTSPATYADTHTICQGNSNQNACFSYANDTWSVTGKNLAPGVMWFEGNLSLVNGNFYNTFIATGNIGTSGGHTTTAVNYAGYNAICLNQYPQNATTRFAGLYPTNFCNQANASLIINSIGNIALLAGGYQDTTFSGGTIDLGSSSKIYGSVIAGDLLLTGGDTTISGYVTAAGQGSGTSNNWGGSTTIDLRNLPAGYDPGGIPDMGEICSVNCTGNQTSWPGQAKVLWSRYL
ncbi:hypothetical protein DNK34_03805 [Pseudomonas dryadis]|uniref:DUF342 domain-containing protein n=2 Tax=Pseudomonadales TaxID=72274 RepID=A0ABY1ZCS3_9GAMM|nr:hypothetical protein DNK34_03805 [Pseudomonas dryadis]TBV18277.1 hypothetical protein DNK41_09500 [Pseudomonas sp. FRB 230]